MASLNTSVYWGEIFREWEINRRNIWRGLSILQTKTWKVRPRRDSIPPFFGFIARNGILNPADVSEPSVLLGHRDRSRNGTRNVLHLALWLIQPPLKDSALIRIPSVKSHETLFRTWITFIAQVFKHVFPFLPNAVKMNDALIYLLVFYQFVIELLLKIYKEIMIMNF